MLIRVPRPEDERPWRALWSEYNAFYGAEVPSAVTDALWGRLLTQGGPVFARLAVDGRGVAGFAHCVLHPITWDTESACLLEDLFVDPRRRGAGVGRKLTDYLVEEAARQGWARLYWHTRGDNAAARRLYDSYAHADGFVRYVLAFRGGTSSAKTIIDAAPTE